MASKKSKKSRKIVRTTRASKVDHSMRNVFYIVMAIGVFALAWIALKDIAQGKENTFNLEYGVLIFAPLVLVIILLFSNHKKS